MNAVVNYDEIAFINRFSHTFRLLNPIFPPDQTLSTIDSTVYSFASLLDEEFKISLKKNKKKK